MATATTMLMSVFTGFCTTASAAITEQTVVPTAATYINNLAPDTNFSEAGVLLANQSKPLGEGFNPMVTDGAGTSVTLVQFDLSQYKDYLVGATLSLSAQCTVSGKNSNVYVAQTDTSWSAADVTWNSAQTIKPVFVADMGNANSGGAVLSADVFSAIENDEDGIVSFAMYTFTGREQKLSDIKLNISVTDTAKTTYKIKYVNEKGEEIKEAVERNGFAEVEYSAETDDTGNFYVGDVLYVYDPSQSETSCVAAADGTACITLVYKELKGALLTEDFSSGDVWGFTTGTGVKVENGALKLCEANNSAKTDTKTFDESVSSLTAAKLSFKWKTAVDLANGGNRQSVFKVADKDGNIILEMSGATNRGGIPTQVRYEVGADVTDASPKLAVSNDWFDVALNMDFLNKTVEGTISQGANVVTIPKTPVSAACLGQLIAQNLSSLAPMYIDDVILTKGDVYATTFKVTSSQDNAPIAGAEVEVNGFTAVTDENGVAVMDMTAGEYSATVSYAKHKPQQVAVTVADAEQEVPVTLTYVGETKPAKIVIEGGDAKIYKPAAGQTSKSVTPYKVTVIDNVDQEMPEAEVVWTSEGDVKGISVDAEGYVVVTDEISFADINGLDVKLIATAKDEPTASASVMIHVNDVAALTSFDIVGPKVVKDGVAATYSVTNTKDQYGVDIAVTAEPTIAADDAAVAVEGMTITPNTGVANEKAVKLTVTLDGVAVTKDITVYGYDFYEPGIGEASIGTPRMEEINGEKVIVWPASSSSAVATYAMTLPKPVELAKGTSKMLNFNIMRYDLSGNHKDVTTQERTLVIKNSAGEALMTFAFQNGTQYLNPSFSSGAVSGSEHSWGLQGEGVNSLNTIVFSTDADGLTKVTIQVDELEPFTYELGQDKGDIASIELVEGKGAPSVRALAITNVKISDSDIVPVEISGDNYISKVYGKEATKQYKASVFSKEEGETFAWTVEALDEIPAETVSLSETKTAATLVPTKSGAAVAVIAEYADGRLVSMTTQAMDVTEGTAVTVDAPEGAKVMLWNSLGEMEPMAEAAVSAAVTEPTIEPTVEPTEMPSAIYITEDGVLHVPYTTTAKAAKISYTSSLDAAKTASLVVEIRDYAALQSFVIDGPAAVSAGESAKYAVTDITDENGDVVDMDAEFAIAEGADIASIDAKTGEMTTTGAIGTVKVSATVGNPDKKLTLTKDVTVANYYYVARDVKDASVTVDVTAMANYAADTEYYVTTAADGKVVTQGVAKAADGKVVVDMAGAKDVEVSPVYSYTSVGSIGDANPFVINIPDGTYDFTFTKANGERADIYVNGVMVGQNVDQYGRGRSSSGSTYEVKDVKVSGGTAAVVMKDKDSNMSAISLKKAPSVADRKQHLYILGDSLVSSYYGTFADEDGDGIPAPGDAQTGWGQVLDKYIKDSVNVTNLAESGNYVKGLYWVLGSILKNAEPGDVVLMEGGYNDKSYSNEDEMKKYMELAYNDATAKGVKLVFVTPNGTPRGDGWKADVVYAPAMKTKCAEMGADCIDLAALSFAINEPLGKDYVNANFIVAGDNLHSSYLGAMRHALTVAQAMYGIDGLKDMVDTEASYELTDSTGATLTFKVVTE